MQHNRCEYTHAVTHQRTGFYRRFFFSNNNTLSHKNNNKITFCLNHCVHTVCDVCGTCKSNYFEVFHKTMSYISANEIFSN